MWRRKASASMAKTSASPRRPHAAARTVRSKKTCSVCVGVNARKSWVPRTAAAAAASTSRSRGGGCRSTNRRRSGEGGPARTRYSYARERASARASKPGGASVTDRTARSAGRRPRSARRIRAGSRSLAVSTLTTCPVACTPASVLPATLRTGGPPRIRSSAPVSSPSTVRSPGWAAQPAKRVPSYSTSSRSVRPAPGGASGVGRAAARRLPGDRDVPRQLEQHHRGRVALARAELHDARVAAVHVPEDRRDVVEQPVAHVLVAQERDRLPAGVEAAVLAERDGALGDAGRHLRLGLGGLG